jgi:hypothetical protein
LIVVFPPTPCNKATEELVHDTTEEEEDSVAVTVVEDEARRAGDLPGAAT